MLANRATAPLLRLAGSVSSQGPEQVPHVAVRDYPANEIGRLAGALHGAFERIRAFVDRERSFTRDISHELRTPLAVMRGAAELMQRQPNLPETVTAPLARIVATGVSGLSPEIMGLGPVEATRRALAHAGMSIEDIDLVEINEAFASVVMAWLKETGYPHERTNVNGGAIALGHPLGASGAKLMTTLLHELERTGGRYGLQTMCEGGGQANVTIIERLQG